MQLLFGLVGTMAMTLIAVLVAVKFREIELGPLPRAALKLAAIAAASMALYILVSLITKGLLPSLPLGSLAAIPLGSVVALVAYGVLSFALLGVFFDLDHSDAGYCVSVMIVIAIAMFFVAKAVGINLVL
jgi:hypothetical protein